MHGRDSFDNWDLAIDTLLAWGVLLPNVGDQFRSLKETRNRSLHFRPETDVDDRDLALSALRQFADIVRDQFSGFGNQPWFIPGVDGASFLKKDWESRPFIQLAYLPSCALVGPCHQMEPDEGKWRAVDDHSYEEREVSDEEFATLYAASSVPTG